ncbi:hypothetical protein [Beggiatoa leptomitoformis]|uniref:hypothetical protein n=1 Tax=Beggiatoa leptomitoformis TaxID=288004 RepID=UPI000A3FFC8E|nr:hypothetical protein [Beggiatoa leptomitoformis]
MSLEQVDWVGGKPIRTEMDNRLAELETTIAKELKAFYRVGNALAEIRDNRLYKLKGYKSFEEYCVTEWEMHRQHAHRLINASSVVKNLYPIGNKLPENEAQVRPLVKLSPEKQREVWQAVCESDKPVTAEQVQAVVNSGCAVVPENKAKILTPEQMCIADSYLCCRDKERKITSILCDWNERSNNIQHEITTKLLTYSSYRNRINKELWDRLLSVYKDIELVDKALDDIEKKLGEF